MDFASVDANYEPSWLADDGRLRPVSPLTTFRYCTHCMARMVERGAWTANRIASLPWSVTEGGPRSLDSLLLISRIYWQEVGGHQKLRPESVWDSRRLWSDSERKGILVRRTGQPILSLKHTSSFRKIWVHIRNSMGIVGAIHIREIFEGTRTPDASEEYILGTGTATSTILSLPVLPLATKLLHPSRTSLHAPPDQPGQLCWHRLTTSRRVTSHTNRRLLWADPHWLPVGRPKTN